MLRIDAAVFAELVLGLTSVPLACAAGPSEPRRPPVVARVDESEAPDARALGDDAPDAGAAAARQPSAVGGPAEETVLADPADELATGGFVGLTPGGSGLGLPSSDAGALGWGIDGGTIGHGSGSAGIGALDKTVISRGVKARVGAIKLCYERELTEDPTFEAKVVVRFVISRSGSVSSATVQTPSGRTSLDQCVVTQVKKMRFPAPHGGVVSVSYPFIFKPG